ncbi:MAG: lipoxygenase family protein [bacterium]
MMGLANRYEIGGITSYGRDFLYDKQIRSRQVTNYTQLKQTLSSISPVNFAGVCFDMAKNEMASAGQWFSSTQSLTSLAIESPEQWTISWTTFPEVYQNAIRDGLDKTFSATLTDADAATKAFWPTIAENGLAYNLLILKKMNSDNLNEFQSLFGNTWEATYTKEYENKRLYVIDLRIFEAVKSGEIDGFPRFTPGAVILLTQNELTKDLTPVAIRISNYHANEVKLYNRSTGTTDSAWIYALLAAKCAVTVWGIWIGHVWHWHIVTAAAVMTMFNTLNKNHPVYQILSPQSDYLIGFDNVLLILWGTVAPPTSITSSFRFLYLLNEYGAKNLFFDDDPIATLNRNGITESDFSQATPWDKYPLVEKTLKVWSAAEDYISNIVDYFYSDDNAVKSDKPLQQWAKDSGKNGEGNIGGFPESIATRDELKEILTSLIYRVTVHGSARLNATPNPVMSFVPNFPPCLQKNELIDPSSTMDTKSLMNWLPKTGTIGEMMQFYFTFAFSVPYEPFIPLEGINDPSTYFYDNKKCNQSLVEFRLKILEILHELSGDMPQVFQWPLNIET